MADALSRRRRRENLRSVLRLVVVLLLVLVASGVFLVINAFDPLLVLPYRLPSLGAMLCVGWASGVSTVMFQTVTGNRILTPSVLGLDALYALLQVVLLLVLGAAGFSSLPDLGAFVLTLLVMIGVSVALMGAVLGARRSVTTLVLLGIVLGTFLRSGTTFIQRLLDPNDFLILQDRLFASFGSINPDLLVLSLVLTAAVSILAIRELRALDVVALGPDIATALGVDHRRISRRVMVMVAVLVSVSTALVGPIMFLGYSLPTWPTGPPVPTAMWSPCPWRHSSPCSSWRPDRQCWPMSWMPTTSCPSSSSSSAESPSSPSSSAPGDVHDRSS